MNIKDKSEKQRPESKSALRRHVMSGLNTG